MRADKRKARFGMRLTGKHGAPLHAMVLTQAAWCAHQFTLLGKPIFTVEEWIRIGKRTMREKGFVV